MNSLYKENIKYLVVHTAAARYYTDASIIKDWHIDRGFCTIGYHFIIKGSLYDRNTRLDSILELGRPLYFAGAHVLGLNKRSIGVCLTGHGDYFTFTEKQKIVLFALYDILKLEIPDLQLVGHRETKYLDILNKFKTVKTCPGTKIDMDYLRAEYEKLQNKYGRIDYDKLTIMTQLNPKLNNLYSNIQNGRAFDTKRPMI